MVKHNPAVDRDSDAWVRGRSLLVVWAIVSTSNTTLGAELPPTIQVDRALVKAERQIAEGSFSSALATLDGIVRLNESHDSLAMPDEFWFHHATAAYRSGSFERALDSLERYLKIAGARWGALCARARTA